MRLNDFALIRGAMEPITIKQTAEKLWEPRFLAEIIAGRFQDPPYLTTTPFHRFGVTVKVKEETKCDRRIGLQEENSTRRRLQRVLGDPLRRPS